MKSFSLILLIVLATPCLLFAEGIDFSVAAPGKWIVEEYSQRNKVTKLLNMAKKTRSGCLTNAILNNTQEELSTNLGQSLRVGFEAFGCGNGKSYPATLVLVGTVSGKRYVVQNFEQKMTSGGYAIYIGN